MAVAEVASRSGKRDEMCPFDLGTTLKTSFSAPGGEAKSKCVDL